MEPAKTSWFFCLILIDIILYQLCVLLDFRAAGELVTFANVFQEEHFPVLMELVQSLVVAHMRLAKIF
jgi:hypothetical protein